MTDASDQDVDHTTRFTFDEDFVRQLGTERAVELAATLDEAAAAGVGKEEAREVLTGFLDKHGIGMPPVVIERISERIADPDVTAVHTDTDSDPERRDIGTGATLPSRHSSAQEEPDDPERPVWS